MDKVKKQQLTILGQNFRACRKAAGMSQEAIASASGVPLGNIRNWEQALRSPSFLNMIEAAKAIGVSLDALAENVAAVKRRPKARAL